MSTSAPTSKAMDDALTCSTRGLVWAPRLPTIEALIRRKLATSAWRATPEGLVKRDEIIAEREHIPARPDRPEAVKVRAVRCSACDGNGCFDCGGHGVRIRTEHVPRCCCDANPDTSDGPSVDCPLHGYEACASEVVAP